jgi:hypothetical protein
VLYPAPYALDPYRAWRADTTRRPQRQAPMPRSCGNVEKCAPTPRGAGLPGRAKVAFHKASGRHVIIFQRGQFLFFNRAIAALVHATRDDAVDALVT